MWARASRRSVSRNKYLALILLLLCLLSFVLITTTFLIKRYETGNLYLSSSRDTTSEGVKTGTRSFHQGGDTPSGNPEWRKAADYYTNVFQSLLNEGFLSPGSRSLCVGSPIGPEVFALKEIGVHDAVGSGTRKSPPLVGAGDPLLQVFGNAEFEFVFAGAGIVEGSTRQSDLAAELERTLKPGSFLVVHTSSAGDAYCLNSFSALFPSCRLVRSREIAGFEYVPVVREIVLQKEEEGRRGADILDSKGKEEEGTSLSSGGQSKNNRCSVPEHKRKLLESLEPLIEEEPLKPWVTLGGNVKNFKYLPSLVDINFKRRYVYIDVGARTYASSIGNLFMKKYPKQNKRFEIYAFEADEYYHAEYATMKEINFLPFAAWTRNETLSFRVNHNTKRRGSSMGSIVHQASSGSSSPANLHSIQGIDFAEWLKNTVSETDFVVIKMDVEGTEFDLMPRLFETGAICLVDELLLECHYNRWKKCCPGGRMATNKTYTQCLDMFSSLRAAGVPAHQWW